ncbi:MAG: ribosome small subunit-dependent GTPase A [Bacteroidales bacterium]|nr:ribosome small subunit-dependent GTPase A [Bacteroidales bacterium]
MKGIVIKSTGSWSTVLSENKEIIECRLKGQFRIHGIRTTNPVAVGDHIEFEYPRENEHGIIYEIYERHNYLIRKSIKLSKSAHIIASNIDRLYVIASIEQPRTPTGFIDRVLVTSEAYHIPASIVFNKTDLYSIDSTTRYNELIELYDSLGYGTHAVSAIQGNGIEELRNTLKGKVNLFTGHSGVGKSALINAIDPLLNIRTGHISDYHNKGMHTTTFAEMHVLSSGGYIIDTPGIKEFGLVHFESKEVAERFPEFRALLPECRYHNCTHVHEPGCAVKEALAKGLINKGRYSNYLSILNDENLDTVDFT